MTPGTPPGACLYIADTGDNEVARKSVVIYDTFVQGEGDV